MTPDMMAVLGFKHNEVTRLYTLKIGPLELSIEDFTIVDFTPAQMQAIIWQARAMADDAIDAKILGR